MGNFENVGRRTEQIRQPHSNQDIHGSVPGTLRKSMATVRTTNPLSPSYQFPGRDEPDSMLKIGDIYKDTTSLNKSYNFAASSTKGSNGTMEISKNQAMRQS